jgi:hypothetical protein
VHFDNSVVTGSRVEILKQLESNLKDFLEIKWQEGLETIVGVEVTRDAKGFTLHQKKLIDKVLLDHWDKKSCSQLPLPSGSQSVIAGEGEGDPSTSTAYLSLVGCLSYLAVGTRPDIAFAVNYMARFSANPTLEQWKALWHIVNYLANTKEKYLYIHPKETDKPLTCFSDTGSNVPPMESF